MSNHSNYTSGSSTRNYSSLRKCPICKEIKPNIGFRTHFTSQGVSVMCSGCFSDTIYFTRGFGLKIDSRNRPYS